MLSHFDPDEEDRNKTVDYDPAPVYMDEADEDSPKKRVNKRKAAKAAKAAAEALPLEEDFDKLPTLTGEKPNVQHITIGGGEGEGVQITVDTEKQWYVIHCYSGYENKV